MAGRGLVGGLEKSEVGLGRGQIASALWLLVWTLVFIAGEWVAT